MNEKHTPTPWRIEQVNYSQGLDVSFEVFGDDDSLVCQTIMQEKKSPDLIRRDFQNMTITVRAVNSHASLVEALEHAYLAMQHPTGDQQNWKDILENKAMVIARAALALAKGEK